MGFATGVAKLLGKQIFHKSLLCLIFDCGGAFMEQILGGLSLSDGLLACLEFRVGGLA